MSTWTREDQLNNWVGYYELYLNLFGIDKLKESVRKSEAPDVCKSLVGHKDEESYHLSLVAARKVISDYDTKLKKEYDENSQESLYRS